MRKEMGLSSAASCGGFSDRENGKKLYIYIQVWGGWTGTVLPPWREFTTRPRADVHSDSLSDQVPVEVIGNLLIGTRRWDRWPRNHVVCCQGERQAIKETGWAASPSPAPMTPWRKRAAPDWSAHGPLCYRLLTQRQVTQQSISHTLCTFEDYLTP